MRELIEKILVFIVGILTGTVFGFGIGVISSMIINDDDPEYFDRITDFTIDKLT